MLKLVPLGVAALVLAAAGGTTALGAERTVKIAALYNSTGGMSSIDAPGLAGAELKAALVNEAGGVLGGRPIEIIAYDTKTDRAEAERAAQEALAREITAGIGYGDTDFVMAAAHWFQKAGVPFVTSGATHPELPARIGDQLFMTAFGDDDQAHAIADYALDELGAERVALWTEQSMDFTRALAAFFKARIEERGGEIVLEDRFMVGDEDFSRQTARLAQLDPPADAVFIAAIPSEAGGTVEEVRRAGLELPILSGDGFDTELVASVPGPDLAHDVYFSTHTFRADERAVVRDFTAAYKEAYGEAPVSAFAALGFDAVGLLIAAIERAGSSEPVPVRDALAATRGYDGVTGTISYTRESGVPPKPVAIIEVEDGDFSVVGTWRPVQGSD